MGKYAKIIFVFVACFVLTGCTVSYNLNINKSFEVTESISIMDSNRNLESTYGSTESGVSNILSTYKSSGETYDYVFRETYGEETSGVSTSKSYPDLNQFRSLSSLAQQYVENFEIDETENVIDLTIDIFYPFIGEGNSGEDPFTDLNVTIHSAYVVTKQNADQASARSSDYTWTLNADHPKKTIEMKIDKTQPVSKTASVSDVLPFKFSFEMFYVILLVGILVVIGFFVFKEHFRNNRL